MKGFSSSSNPAPSRRGALLAGALGLLALMASGSAAALTCGPVYSSQIINGNTFSARLYRLNGTVATLDSTAGQNLDGIGQATDTNVYFDNGANTTIRRFTGAATTAFGTNWTSFGGNPGSSGQGGGADGNIYYVGSDRHLYRVTTAGVITDLGLVNAAAAADATIWANMSAGDLASDANGRLYWLGSSGSNSYLFRIDRNTLQAYNLGVYGASGATGLAFNTAGLLVSTIITGNTTSVFTIDLASPNTGGTVLGNATGYSNNGAALDLASCNAPTLNPALATTKSVVNVTRSQTPATFAMPGDVLEYTVTISNTGNLPAELVTLSDAIPANTTYVAGSTTLNGTAVADAPAGTMPYSPASSGTREVHSTGRPAGEVLAGGAAGAAVVRFRVTVGAAPLPATIDNQATASYFTMSGGTSTPQTAPSPLVQTPVPNPRLTLTKVTLGGFGGPFTFTGSNGWTSQNISTSAAGVGASGATQTFAATGVATTITESAMPAGYALSALACSNVPAGGNATVDLVARTVTFDAAAMVRGADIACTFTNTFITTDLSITKTDGQTLYAPGQTNTYTIVVANAGPNAANGAVFTDPAVAGLTVGSVTCGSATGGAVCPASPTVAAMQGAGIAIPTLPSGGSVTFTVTATVAAGTSGNLTNSASIAAPSGVSDTNAANNSASDTDTLQPNFGTCDARMFLSQGPDANTPTTLQLISTATNPFTYPVLGVGTVPYNAIGYNPLDNYLYGLRSGTGAGNIVVRVGPDGSTVEIGPVSGLPTNLNYLAGDISPTGVYYVKESAASTLYAINLSTLTATAIPLSQTFNSLDMAWIGGTLYSVAGGGQLYAINPATGTVTAIGSNSGLGAFGALYGSPNGLYANNNTGSGFYQYDLATGVPTLISSSPGSQTNDGAHCVNANITFGADIAVTKTDGSTTYTPGTNVTYTITATNGGPFGAQNVTVSDPLPAGITTASWTCTASGGGVCAASGSGAINDNTVDLPVGAVATYTLVLTVPANYTGNLTNTATATVDPGNNDPTPGNNTATDTDTQNSRADLSITKTNTPGVNGEVDQAADLVTSGVATTYSIVVTNNGPSSADGAVVTDPATAGLTCTTATCSATGGATCPAQTGAALVAALQGAGTTVPTLPAGGSATFTLSCQVP